MTAIKMKISQKILTQKSLGLMAESEQNTSGRILRYFALETNIEGINNAGRSRSLIRASVWLGIFVSLVALTISDMNDLIKGTEGRVLHLRWCLMSESLKNGGIKRTLPSMYLQNLPRSQWTYRRL